MAALGGHGRPNLKICIDNEEDCSSSDADEILHDGKNNEESGFSSESDNTDVEPDKGDITVVGHVNKHDKIVTLTAKTPTPTDPSPLHPADSDPHAEERPERRRYDYDDVVMEEGEIRGPRKYENKEGDFITGFDPTSKENVEKKEKRAKRFGIEKESTVNITDEDIQKLYKSLGVTDLSVSERGIRLEALHLRGVDEMSTQDIFTYFQEFGPGSVEWIDDTSCNVVWLDRMTTARAMLALSKDPEDYSKLLESQSLEPEESKSKAETKELERMETTTDEANKKESGSDGEYDDNLDLMSDDDEEKGKSESKTTAEKSVSSKEADVDSSKEKSSSKSKSEKPFRRKSIKPPIPELTHLPPGKWRIGKAGLHAEELYVRFATKADKKLPRAEKHSKYYVKYGNPNYGGIKGLLSEGKKRKMRAQRTWQKDNDEFLEEGEEEENHGREKVQYMDQEDEVIPDAEEWGVPAVPSSLKSRITLPLPPSPKEEPTLKRRSLKRHRRSSSEEESEKDEDLEKLLASPVKKRYMRMHADDLEEEIKAKRVATIPAKTTIDARNRIENRRQYKQLKIDEYSSDSSNESDYEDNDYSSSLKKCADLRTKLRGQKDSKRSSRIKRDVRESLRHQPRLTIQVQHE